MAQRVRQMFAIIMQVEYYVGVGSAEDDVLLENYLSLAQSVLIACAHLQR